MHYFSLVDATEFPLSFSHRLDLSYSMTPTYIYTHTLAQKPLSLVYDSIGLPGQYESATCWSLSLVCLRLRL
jgi:hypothetical protein